jgi:hypothetical protein
VSAPAFTILALVALVLLAYLVAPRGRKLLGRRRPSARRRNVRLDPGGERRAERRARSLLKSIVNRDEWEMYRDLGFIRVLGQGPERGAGRSPTYGYLIYPHKPIVAYLPGSNSLLSEYCVEFPDPGESLYGPKLPDSDDVLAKWMMIKADEHRLIGDANMHLPGRQVDPQRVRRDLWRLAEWERSRERGRASAAGDARNGADRYPARAA